MGFAIMASFSLKVILSRNSFAFFTDRRVAAIMDFPAIVTARLEGFNRSPLHTVQGLMLMYCCIFSLASSDCDSLCFLARWGIMPSNVLLYSHSPSRSRGTYLKWIFSLPP